MHIKGKDNLHVALNWDWYMHLLVLHPLLASCAPAPHHLLTWFPLFTDCVIGN